MTGSPVDVRSGTLLGNRFVIRELLGRGAVGTVFSALDTKVGEKVAIKILHPDLLDHRTLERFRREVRACRPGHPNVVTVYDLHQDDGLCYLSLELVEGPSLRGLLGEGERLGVEETIAVGRQVASALHHLHQRGVVHRDVKPGNILVPEQGEARLCDMGLARPMAEGVTVTETEMVVGTPAYMAPEQGLSGELTAASDVYALGLTLHRCLTGEVPLQEDTAMATLMLRQRSKSPSVRTECTECPRWLHRLLRRMLDPEPDRRPTAAEVEEAFVGERVRMRLKPHRRHVFLTIALIIVAVGLVASLRAVFHRPAVSIEVIGTDVVGFDEGGGEVWRRSFDYSRVDAKLVDLDGDGYGEVLVVGSLDSTLDPLSEEPLESGIFILSATGKPISTVVPEHEIGSWNFRHRLEVIPQLQWIDLDQDGILEVIAICTQRRYFPTVVLVYWPHWDVWDLVLRHPGKIYKVFPVSDGAAPGFRFLALNNRLAMMSILGSIKIIPYDQRSTGIQIRLTGLGAPPYSGLSQTEGATWVDYAPFVGESDDSNGATPRLTEAGNGTLEVSLHGMSVRFDEFLNPVDGPNAGVDLRDMRADFYRLLSSVKPGYRSFSAAGVAEVRGEIAQRCELLLHEQAYQVIYSDAIARGLARAGDYEGAVVLLEEEYPRLQNDDLGYLLGNLEAIRGDLELSAHWLRHLMDSGTTQRAGFDAPKELLRVSIEARDLDEVASSISYVNGNFFDEAPMLGLGATLWAGVRLWWDEATPADTGVRSIDLAEDGDAVACLARWRRGGSRPDDADAMRRFIISNPDSEGIGRAALAASLLAHGDPEAAIAECDEGAMTIQGDARIRFTEHQNLQLIRALRTVALLESGDRELARREAMRLAEDLNPNLLPGILVAEVISETEN